MNSKVEENIFSFVRPLWSNISLKRKKQLLTSLLIILLNGILDLVSVTSILPLLYLLSSDKDMIMETNVVKLLVNIFRFESYNEILVFSSIIFAFVAIFSGSLRLFNLYFNTRLSGLIASDISTVAFSKVLYQPFSYHVNLKSSEVITSIASYVNTLNAGLINFMQFITGVILSIFIVIGALFISWKLSLLGLIIYSSMYLFIALYGKKRLKRNSRIITDFNIRIVKGIQESLGSIRDIILGDLQDYYIKLHKGTESSTRRLVANNMFLTFFPRYALEAITLVLISIIILFRSNIFAD